MKRLRLCVCVLTCCLATYAAPVSGSNPPGPHNQHGNEPVWEHNLFSAGYDPISFNGGTVYDPLIASLAIDCGVKVTILGADTRTIDGKAFGTMLLLLPDDPNEAAKALSYIRSQPNITAEEVEYHA